MLKPWVRRQAGKPGLLRFKDYLSGGANIAKGLLTAEHARRAEAGTQIADPSRFSARPANSFRPIRAP